MATVPETGKDQTHHAQRGGPRRISLFLMTGLSRFAVALLAVAVLWSVVILAMS